jgi:polyhydroxyalkanoate synthase
MSWQSAYRSRDLTGRDPRFVLAASDHAAGVINLPARNRRSHWINDNLNGDEDNRLEGAEKKPGSPWPDWDD